MIPVHFYRDKDYVYINNTDGITKKMTIEEFNACFSDDSGGGGGDEPQADIVVRMNLTDQKMYAEDLVTPVSYTDLITPFTEGKTIKMLSIGEDNVGTFFLVRMRVLYGTYEALFVGVPSTAASPVCIDMAADSPTAQLTLES